MKKVIYGTIYETIYESDYNNNVKVWWGQSD